MEAVVCIINDVEKNLFLPIINFFFYSNHHTAHECDFVDNKIMCTCRKGYEVDDDDEKNCVDVDECVDDEYSRNERFVKPTILTRVHLD